MSQCDVCRVQCMSSQLTELKEEYREDDIRWVCSDCMSGLNEILIVVDAAIAKIQKRNKKSAIRRGIEALSTGLSAVGGKLTS